MGGHTTEASLLGLWFRDRVLSQIEIFTVLPGKKSYIHTHTALEYKYNMRSNESSQWYSGLKEVWLGWGSLVREGLFVKSRRKYWLWSQAVLVHI